jgi:hypothetical protein
MKIKKRRGGADLESLPSKMSLHRQVEEMGERRDLSENPRPLLRYLDRQVNRPWNRVYSQICSRIDGSNIVQAHLLAHLEWHLKVRHVRKVGAPLDAPCGLLCMDEWRGWRPMRTGDLYVDPDDGIIKRARLEAKPGARG